MRLLLPKWRELIFNKISIFNLRKFSPPILTLLVFLLAQGVGAAILLLLGVGVEFIAILSFVLMAVFIIAVLCCHFFLHYICFSTAFDVSSISWCPGMLAIVSGIFGALSMSILFNDVELSEEVLLLQLAMSRNFWGLLTLIIIGPIAEELLFREAIAGEMLRRGANPWVAIVVSAVAFSIMHLNLAQGLYALPIGLLFGIIYYKTGNIVLTSLLHIVNNGITALQLYTMGEDAVDISYAELLGSNFTAYSVMVLFGVLSILFMKWFWETYEERRKHTKLCKKEQN